MITWLTKVEHKPIQMVSVNDIAFFGAHALLNPGDYNGKAISLGGDLVTRDKLESEWKQVGLPEHFLTDVPEEVVKEAFAGSALETLTEVGCRDSTAADKYSLSMRNVMASWLMSRSCARFTLGSWIWRVS